MATRLLNIVSFLDVAAGATVSLPHGLNENGTAVIPDRLESNSTGAGQFTITADAINVTVKNEGGAPESIDVWAERIHSIPRQLGGDPGPDALVVQPWIMTGGGASPSFVAQSRLVFRPGAADADDPGPGVFTDWQSLYDRFLDLRIYGSVAIEFDSRFSPVLDPEGVPACQIPAGTWDMEFAIWMDANTNNAGDRIVFADNCIVNNLTALRSRDGLILAHDGVVNSPIQVAHTVHFLGGFTRLYNTDPGALPIFLSTGFMALELAATPLFVGNGPGTEGNGFVCAAPLFDGAGFPLIVPIHFALICDNAFAGTAVMRWIQSENGPMGPTTYDFPGFVGLFIRDNLTNKHGDRWRSFAFDDVDVYTSLSAPTPHTGAYTAFPNDIVPVDTSGGIFAVTFPPATGIGEVVTVKDLGGACGTAPVTMTPNGADTIEDPFLATAFGTRAWVSDGLGNWRLIRDEGSINGVGVAEAANFDAAYDTAHVAGAAGAITATLPLANLRGREISIHNLAGAGGAVTVSPSGGDSISGNTSIAAGETVAYVADGATTWVQKA